MDTRILENEINRLAEKLEDRGIDPITFFLEQAERLVDEQNRKCERKRKKRERSAETRE